MRRIPYAAIAGSATFALSAQFASTEFASAQTARTPLYPTRPITFVAATAAGGPGDIAARLIGERMAVALGQPIVVENIAGAGGVQGTARVARAEPDGYTLLVHQTGIAIAPSVTGNVSFNVEKDLTTVGLVNTSYLVLVGRASLPASDLVGLVAWMTAADRRTRFAHPGVGTLGHLATAVFTRSTKANVDAIPYRGIAPAVNDLLGDHVDLVWLGAVAAAPHVQTGKLKGYAVGGPKRLTTMPDVPHAAELKLPELDMPFWHALFAPSATPKPIVEKLNAALRETLADPAIVSAYEKTGVESFAPNMLSADVAHAFVKSEIARWSSLARETAQK